MNVVTQLFLVYFGVILAAVLRRADVWAPFRPDKLTGPHLSRDILRVSAAFFFLIILPACYFLWIYPKVLSNPPAMPTKIYSLETTKLAYMITLVLPIHSFYAVWQFIVRRWPATFYPDVVGKQVREKVPDAFEHSASALVIGVICLIPLVFVGWL